MTAGLVAAMLGAKVMFARAPDFVSRYALHIAFMEIGWRIGTFMSSFFHVNVSSTQRSLQKDSPFLLKTPLRVMP